jgi:hypothetical protein
VWPDRFLSLGDEKLAVVVQEAVQRLKHLAGRKVKLVEDKPVPAPEGGHEEALAKLEAALRRRRITAKVLSKVSVLVVVYANAFVPCKSR